MSKTTVSLFLNGELLPPQNVKEYEPLTDEGHTYVPGMESDEFTENDRRLVFCEVKTKEEILAEKEKNTKSAEEFWQNVIYLPDEEYDIITEVEIPDTVDEETAREMMKAKDLNHVTIALLLGRVQRLTEFEYEDGTKETVWISSYNPETNKMVAWTHEDEINLVHKISDLYLLYDLKRDVQIEGLSVTINGKKVKGINDIPEPYANYFYCCD